MNLKNALFCFQLCCCLLVTEISMGRTHVGAAEMAESGSPENKSPITAEIVGLPDILYLGEELNFILRIRNNSPQKQNFTVDYRYGEKNTSQQINITADNESVAVFPLALPSIEEKCRADLSIRISGAKDSLWRDSFIFVDGRGDLENVYVQTDRYVNLEGQSVVLVNRYEVESEYRRWAPLRWVKRKWRRRNSRRIFWAPEDHAARPADDSHVSVKFIPYAGEFLRSPLSIKDIIPHKGAVILIIAWGSDEAFGRLPPRNMIRALDLAIDRARDRNPACQILLLTPPPILGAEDATREYVSAICDLGREHHAPVLDLYKLIMRQENWQHLYVINGDPAITTFWPNSEGRNIVIAAMEDALR